MSQHFGKLGSILVIALSKLDFKMFILMFDGSSHFCLSLSLLPKFLLSSIYVVHKLGFSLITFNLFFMWLGKCNYICLQVCRYAGTFILLTSHNLLCGYIKDKTIQLYHKEPLWAYCKFGSSLPQNYSTLRFMICCKEFLSMMVHNRQTKVILILVIFFQKSICSAYGKFSFLPNSVQG